MTRNEQNSPLWSLASFLRTLPVLWKDCTRTVLFPEEELGLTKRFFCCWLGFCFVREVHFQDKGIGQKAKVGSVRLSERESGSVQQKPVLSGIKEDSVCNHCHLTILLFLIVVCITLLRHSWTVFLPPPGTSMEGCGETHFILKLSWDGREESNCPM